MKNHKKGKKMSKISKDKILQACTKGIKKSFNEYLEWSADEWLWNAPEYLLTVNIAKKLWMIKKTSKYITLEDNLKKTLKSADAKIKGQLKSSIRPDGRSDIIFWWGKGTPRGIIEVKNGIYRKEQIQEDLERIYGILEKESDIEFGISTFYIDRYYESGNAKEKLETRIQNEFIEPIEGECKEKGFVVKYNTQNIIMEDNQGAYAVAIMICK